MNTRIILASLIIFSTIPAFAQEKQGMQNEGIPVVTVGTIDAPVTSREKVLAYPRLLAHSLSCEVTDFEFSLTSGGKTWGPVAVKGTAFSVEVKDKIKETEPENVKISITNIHLKCSGQQVTANPINLEYNH